MLLRIVRWLAVIKKWNSIREKILDKTKHLFYIISKRYYAQKMKIELYDEA